ncbi:MAG: phosphoglycerate kinase, partial [Acidimicrobiia bacterium]
VVDDFRIRAAAPTLQRLLDRDARVVVCSHLGRPQGPDPELSLAPVADRLGEVGGFQVDFTGSVVGPEAQAAVDAGGGHVVMLENTRFEPGETTNDPLLADGLAQLCDLFVLDAFGTAHRAHASTVGIAQRRRSAAGVLLQAEVGAFSRLLQDPPRPFVVVLGGAKVSDKLGVLRALLPTVDAMLIGGGMCFTLLLADGYRVGRSLVDEDLVDEVRHALKAPEAGKIMLPVDLVAADRFAADASTRTVASRDIPSDHMGLDIGPDTVASFTAVLANAASVFWNGPMGVFEWPQFRAGTEGVAAAVAGASGFTVVGGGDSVAALRLLGVDDAVSHLSTGGGAGLEMLQGASLPGIRALGRWIDA